MSWTWSSVVQLSDGFDGIGVFGLLVVPIAYHAGEPKRQPAWIMRAVLQAVERDLHDEFGFHLDNVANLANLQLLQSSRLPVKQLVRHTLERLAQHNESAAG